MSGDWIGAEHHRNAALDLLVGKRLGRGWCRHVYPLNQFPDRVLKLEHAGWSWSNITEWQIWQAVKDTPNAQWFAECFDIDQSGRALTQARTEPFTEDEFKDRVKELPVFFDDIHWGNFGKIDGRVVCHDYGRHRLFQIALQSTKMKPVSH